MLGTTLRHYRVDSKIGEGGMGVVYKGWDTHLDRPVAIKVLLPKTVADPERKRRFVQEAKAASALHHPNIVIIHDVDSEDGVDFIVMEYIDGETLDRRIPSRGMRLAQALKYAVQIADALARAHGAGIVHRDLKPGNIMVDRHEQVKVLDFGLAKLTEPTHGDADATVTVSPHTEEGTIVGTVAYMSPEQAEGKLVDGRSDIFSLGSMLYELVTGVRPFQAETRMSTLSAVISRNPEPVTAKVATLPHELERIISRCLRKDPDRRFQQMNEVKLALEDLREESESGSMSQGPVAAPQKRRSYAWLAAVLAILLAGGAGLVWWRGRHSQTSAPAVMTRVTADEGLTTDPALSRDGKLIAYASDRAAGDSLDIWVQHLGGGEPVRLTRWDSDEREPDFSPDGSRIVFSSNRNGGGIYMVPVLGGEATPIAPKGFRPRFSPDGNLIAYWVGSEGATLGVTMQQVFVVPVNGGDPRRLAADLAGASYPVWSPDGKSLLVTGWRGTGSTLDWWTVPLESGPARPTGMYEVLRRSNLRTSDSVASAWTQDGRSILFSGGSGDTSNLFRARISGNGTIKDDPERITFGTGIETEPALGGGGQVALASQSLTSHLWSLPMDTNRAKVTGQMTAVTKEATMDTTVRVSPEGTKLLYLSSALGRRKLILRDLEKGTHRELAPGRSLQNWISLVQGGRTAIFSAASDKERGVYSIDLAGGVPVLLTAFQRGGFWGASPDGRYLAMWETGQYRTLVAFDTQTHTQFQFASHQDYQLLSPHFFEDSRWVAIHARNSEMTRQIYVFPFHPGRETPPSEWVPITEGKQLDRDPWWSPDGNLLYFLADRGGARGIYAQRLDPATKRPVGAQMEVIMFRTARRSMMHFSNSGLSAPAVAPGKIVFALGEMTGNVWLTKLP